MNSHYVASIDGFGERDDIALAREKDLLQISENKDRERFEAIEAVANATVFGSSSTAEPLSKIVQQMLEKGSYQALMLKSQIVWDVDSISEALNEACIQLGLDEEEFAPHLSDQGNEVEITLV